MRMILGFLVTAVICIPSIGHAGIEGQVINCDAPDPAVPSTCVDNWALDILDEDAAAIQTSAQNGWDLPRNRKHYFDADGTGVHIFILDKGVQGDNPEFCELASPTCELDSPESRIGEPFLAVGHSEPVDESPGSHGTRVAGIAAGLKFGIAKGATVHPIMSRDMLKGFDDFRTGNLEDRLAFVKDKFLAGADPAILNMSFNIPTTSLTAEEASNRDLLTTKIQELINLGVVVVASAGNKNESPSSYWPSEIPDVIVVGGVDEKGDRWIRESEPGLCTTHGDCGSNFGPDVDLWAPAKLIRSAVNPDENTAPLIRSGTSFAAPIVTGLAALQLEVNPTATPTQVLNALRSNGVLLPLVDGDPFTNEYMVRSPVGTPACNVPQRLFTNADTQVPFSTGDLVESCPSGYSASSLTSPSHGQLSVAGIAPSGILYNFMPNASYEGPDVFNYTIKTSSGATHGTGTTKITVQEDVN